MSILSEMFDRGNWISYNKKIAHTCGVNSSVLLGYLVSKQEYWQNKKEEEGVEFDGIFFSTIEDVEEDTALTKKQQMSALKDLIDKKFIEVFRAGTHGVRHFKILESNILSFLDKSQKGTRSNTKKEHDKSQKETSSSRKREQDQVPKSDTTDIDQTNIINTDTTDTNITTTAAQKRFIQAFTEEWCLRSRTDTYRKKDLNIVKEIEDLKLATKLIPVLWSVDEVDKWVRKSDHTLTVFVKEFNSGRLESLYPNTKWYYKDKQRAEAKTQ